MSVEKPVFAIITCSDTRGPECDTAGDALESLIEEQGWACRTHMIVKDDRAGIAAGKAAGGVGIAVRVGQIGFDVYDGRFADHIRAADIQHRRIRLVQGHTLQLHGGEPQAVRPEGRTGGEHAHALVVAQLGRTHGGRPALPLRPVKLPDEPDV